jgi:phage terminase Nu1 subunit (DNA packaging protein)
MPLITRSEAAKEMGVTVQAVYGAIKEGRLTAMEDSRGKIVINSDTMKDEWTQKSAFKRMRKAQEASQASKQPVRRVRNSKTSESIPEYEESKARTEHLKAELLELERKQKEQDLVPMSEVSMKWENIITTARTKLLGVPSKAKQRIPDLDNNAMNHLEDIIREALEELSEPQVA